MRRLTRLFLKLIVRITMLMVVVLWLVSHSLGVVVTGDVLSHPFSVVNCRTGLAIATANAGVYMWSMETMTPLDAMEAGWLFEPSSQDLRRFDCVTPWPGMNVVTGSGRVMVAIRHVTLLVTVAVLWIGVEWYDRRRRKREQAGESPGGQ